MTLQQIRYLCEVARRGLSVSDAAAALHTSQPGISKQILALEGELGVQVFVRRGKRLVEITPAGKRLVELGEKVLADAGNLKRAALDLQDEAVGEMVIATTHTQARYVLPKVIPVFLKRFPKVSLFIHQGNPMQVAAEVASGRADLGIATEYLDGVAELVTLPLYAWNRVVVAQKGHPILDKRKLTLADIAAYPLVSYDISMTGRGAVNRPSPREGCRLPSCCRRWIPMCSRPMWNSASASACSPKWPTIPNRMRSSARSRPNICFPKALPRLHSSATLSCVHIPMS